jgi:predicted metal-dependent phosphotriesterase family hydrolase
MTTVETALGPLATDQLGPALMHEHIVTDLVSEDDKRRTRPHWHYTHISDDILPALRAAGVTADQIDQMLVRNPRAIFEAAG